jgi:FSR family fosmidomycin resistance protein-like MFS transporter
MDRRGMALLALAHVATDANQSFLPAMLPALVLQRHLSLAEAGSLVLAQAISSSLIQPLVGHLADRRPLPWLIVVGLLLAGGGMAGVGIAGPFWALALAALASGVGVALFHPEGARFANVCAGSKKATGMRWFAAGGNIGFAVGPLIATAATALWGMHGTLVAVIPAIVVAGMVFIELPRLHRAFARGAASTVVHGHDDWGAFAKLTFFVGLRSTVYLAMVAFTPLIFVRALGASPALGNFALSAYLVAATMGTLVGGPLADRFGRRTILLASTSIASLFVVGYAIGVGREAFVLSVIAVIGVGFVLAMSQTAFIVLGQEFLPNHIGTASGVTLGLAISLGGSASPLLGRIADAHGLPAALLATAVILIAALLVGVSIPTRARARLTQRRLAAAS